MKKSTIEHWNRFWTKNNLRPVNKIIEMLDVATTLEGKLMVEIGAGSGSTAVELAYKGAKVVCLDYSADAVSLIKKNRGPLQTSILPVRGDAHHLPFKNNSFDFCYHQGFLEHFRNPGPLLSEQRRVLNDDGHLMIDVPQRYNIYTVRKHLAIAFNAWFAGWETEYSSFQLRKILSKSGFTPVMFFGRYHIRNLDRIQDQVLGFRLIPRRFEALYARLIRRLENTWWGYTTAFAIGVIAKKRL